MNQKLRNEILNLLVAELPPEFLDDYGQILNGRYLEAIDHIKSRYMINENSHIAQDLFDNEQLSLAQIALHEVAIKHELVSNSLYNETRSNQYPIMHSKSFNFLVVREQAKNKFRGLYKIHWAKNNEWLESKQFELDLDPKVAYEPLGAIEEKITVVIEVFYSMTDIRHNFSFDMEPKAYFKISIPNSKNTQFLTSFSFNELREYSKFFDKRTLHSNVAKPNLVSIKKRFNDAVNE